MMNETIYIGLALLFLVIVYVNDLRIRFREWSNSVAERGDDRSMSLLQAVYRLFFVMMGVLWYFYYWMFDQALYQMEEGVQWGARWMAFGAMMLVLAMVKFGFKRKLINANW